MGRVIQREARRVTRPLFRTFALAAMAAALSACTAISVANTGVRAVGAGVGAGARVVSSTGDVIFDHDHDGK